MDHENGNEIWGKNWFIDALDDTRDVLEKNALRTSTALAWEIHADAGAGDESN